MRHGGSLGEVLRRKAVREPPHRKQKQGLLPYLPDALQVPELSVLDTIRPQLPVVAHHKEIVRSVRENRVTVLSGDTGCGKSTRVPQFLIDEPGLVPDGQLVVVTQPRRIACITIAARVAHERGENVGESVGYQIRFVDHTSPGTRLVFCTTAVMTRKLYSDPNFSKVAVLVIDEVHERDTDTEFLLVALRERILRGEMNIKLVLMSATLSADTFIDYFAEVRSSWLAGLPPDPDPTSSVEIEGRLFGVKEFFLEDALEWTGTALPNHENANSRTMQALETKMQQLRGGNPELPRSVLRSLAVYGDTQVYIDLVKSLVLFLHNQAALYGDENKGAILVFLPGWAAITTLHFRLTGEHGLWTLPLHSQLSPEEQQLVFERPPKGRRKVVLSTTLAETSVTVDDVVYVINSGVLKERVFDTDRQIGKMASMPNTWANATQRAGRVGRTQEGVVVHLFPRWKMTELKRWPTPQILSTSLEEVVLQSLALGLGDPFEVLAKSPSAPSESSIAHALWLLQEMSLIHPHYICDKVSEEFLMPLGRWVATIPVHPMAGKALVYGCLFGALLPVAAAIAFLNLKDPFSKPWPGEEVRGGKNVLAGDSFSDHYAAAVAYLDWRAKVAVGEGDIFVEEHNLSRETLDMADQLVRSLMISMVNDYGYDGIDAAFIHDADSGSWDSRAVFEDPNVWLFTKAALSGAYAPFFARCNGGRFESDCNEELHAHGSSVNARYRPMRNPYAPGGVPGDWVVYTDSMKLGKVNIMESTVISGNHVLLFSRALRPTGSKQAPGQVEFDGWRGTLSGGDAAITALQKARHWLSHSLRKAQDRKLAAVLDHATLERIKAALRDPRFTMTSVSGSRELCIGDKEASTIFVGNLADQADEAELRHLFGQWGKVQEVDLVCDIETGKRRGFGFVTMGSREEAALATQQVAGDLLHSRKLRLDCRSIPGSWKEGRSATGHVRPHGIADAGGHGQKRSWLGLPGYEGNHNQAAAFVAQRNALKGGIIARKMIEAGIREQQSMAKRQRLGDDIPSIGVAHAVKADDVGGKEKEEQEQEQQEQERERRRKLQQKEDREMRRKARDEATMQCASEADRLLQAERRFAKGQKEEQRQRELEAADARDGAWVAEIPENGVIRHWCELLVQAARVRRLKSAAVEREDFKAAADLKDREQRIMEDAHDQQQLALVEGVSPERAGLERAKKQAADNEDYELAAQLKAKLKRLGGRQCSPAEMERSAWSGALLMATKETDGRAVCKALRSAAPSHLKEAMAAIDTSGAGESHIQEEGTRSRFMSVKEELHPEATSGHRKGKRKCASSPGRSSDEADDAAAAAPLIAVKKEAPAEDRAQRAIRERAQVRLERLAQKRKQAKEEVEEAACEEPAPAQLQVLPESHFDTNHGLAIDALRKLTNQELWQRAWDLTWAKMCDAGRGDDISATYAHAQRNWVAWLAAKSGGILAVGVPAVPAVEEDGATEMEAVKTEATDRCGGSCAKRAVSSSGEATRASRASERPQHELRAAAKLEESGDRKSVV